MNPVLESSLAPASPVTSVNPVQIWLFIGRYLWITGIAAMLLYVGFSYIHIRKKVRFSIKEHGNVYICDEIDSPFVFGIVRPKIYLPSGLPEEVAGCVKAHERAHIARCDFLWKPLCYLVLSVYWFHPLCWIAYILFCKDIEIACDQKVTQKRDLHWKARYCQALLSCSINRRMIKACPVAFGEVGVKERIVMIKKYKKPTCIMIVLSVAVCTLVGCCFMTDPVTGKKDSAVVFDIEAVTDTESVRDTPTVTDTEALTSNGNAVAMEAMSGEDKIIPTTVPTINLMDNPDVRSLQILYASDKELMFVGWFGLFLYDTEKNDFIRSVDLLTSISRHPDTETISCEIKAAADGSKVYFHPPMEEYMLVYDVKSNGFEKKPYDLTDIKLYEIPDITNLEEQYELDDPRYSQTRDEYQNKIKYYFNYVHCIGDLVYTRYDDALSRAMPIFKPEEYQQAVYWKHDQVKDLVKAEFRWKGEVYICEDQEALTEISAAIRNAPELKGGSGCEFTYCLYLTNADGEVGMIVPATDSCNAFLTADGYYEPAREAKMNIFELIDRGVFVKTKSAGN